MERSAITPHISWSGPQPDREMDAYLLAMLVRVYSCGLDIEDEEDRDTMLHPSVLTTENLSIVSTMYAYYKHVMESEGIRNTEDMLKMIRDSDEECVNKWLELSGSDKEVNKATAELLEYVDTEKTPGFAAFG